MSEYKVFNDMGIEKSWEELYEDNTMLIQENQQLKLINKEYERLNKDNGRGFKIISVKEYNIDELLKYKDNWETVKNIIEDARMTHWSPSSLFLTELLQKMQELEKGKSE